MSAWRRLLPRKLPSLRGCATSPPCPGCLRTHPLGWCGPRAAHTMLMSKSTSDRLDLDGALPGTSGQHTSRAALVSCEAGRDGCQRDEIAAIRACNDSRSRTSGQAPAHALDTGARARRHRPRRCVRLDPLPGKRGARARGAGTSPTDAQQLHSAGARSQQLRALCTLMRRGS